MMQRRVIPTNTTTNHPAPGRPQSPLLETNLPERERGRKREREREREREKHTHTERERDRQIDR